jgi:hypothetical protein
LIERVNRLFHFQLKSKELDGPRRPHRNLFNERTRFDDDESTAVGPGAPSSLSSRAQSLEQLRSCEKYSFFRAKVVLTAESYAADSHLPHLFK